LRRRSANEVVAISHYEVPFSSKDPHFNSSELIETDLYGRQLFLYNMVDHELGLCDYLENSTSYVYIICQKADRKGVSYYPFVCYSFITESEINSEETVSKLKAANDWGMPINEDKLVSKSIYIDTDGSKYYEEKNNVTSNFFSEIGDTFDMYAYTAFSESNAAKMYIMREYTVDENNMCIYKRSFLVMADASYNIIDYKELTGLADTWKEQIITFDKESR